MENRTELVFILDKSGSMAGLEADTIGGYNAMLNKQKEAEGEAFVTTVLFSHTLEILHDRVNLKRIEPMNEHDYEVGGMTALMDAIATTVDKVATAQKEMSIEKRSNRVLFVITTDGMENASEKYGAETVKTMIANQKKQYDWEFIFLGANIDAIATAAKYGIHEDFAVEYHADSEGTQVNFEALNEAVTTFRQGGKVSKTWKKEIEKDFERR